MSFVLISPEVVSAAAGDLANVGSTISAANKAAAAATTQVLAAGADEVSARIAALFGMYGLEYQAQQPPDNAGRLPMARWQHRLAMAVRPITPGPSHPQHNQLSSRAYARRGSTTPQAMAPLHRSDAARARRRPRAGRRRIPRRW